MAVRDALRPPATAPADDSAAIEAYLRRATERVGAQSDPRDRIYAGTLDTGPQPPGTVQPPRNRRASSRKVSPFSVVIGLIITAVTSVLYISNIIAIGRLVIEIGDLETSYARSLNEQEILKAQVNRMASLERIRQLAEQNLGMRNSEALPGWLTVAPERVAELDELVRQAEARR